MVSTKRGSGERCEVRRLCTPEGTELHIEISGPANGIPLVLTHGFGADSRCWRRIRLMLAGMFRVIVWDLPGSGKSSPTSYGDYSLERMAACLDAVLEATTDRPALLVGHSMGGMIALIFCRLYPERLRERIAGIALMNTTYTSPIRTAAGRLFLTLAEKPLLIPILNLIVHQVSRGQHLELIAGFRWMIARMFGYSPEINPIYCTEDMPKEPHLQGVYASLEVQARQMLAMLAYDAANVLDTLPIPVLIIASERDWAILPEAGAFMHERIPDSEFILLKAAGHSPMLEQIERVHQAMTAFGQRCLRAHRAPLHDSVV